MRTSTVSALALTIGALVGLAGCASSGMSTSSPPDPEGTWQAASPETAYLTIDGSGKLDGDDGCNHFTGTATVVDDEVQFTLNLSTLKACLGVTTSFRELASAIIEGDTMTARNYDGEEIVQLQHRS